MGGKGGKGLGEGVDGGVEAAQHRGQRVAGRPQGVRLGLAARELHLHDQLPGQVRGADGAHSAHALPVDGDRVVEAHRHRAAGPAVHVVAEHRGEEDGAGLAHDPGALPALQNQPVDDELLAPLLWLLWVLHLFAPDLGDPEGGANLALGAGQERPGKELAIVGHVTPPRPTHRRPRHRPTRAGGEAGARAPARATPQTPRRPRRRPAPRP